MTSEAKRGKAVLPNIQAQLADLQGVLIECVLRILHPGVKVDEMLVENLFRVQDKVFTMLSDTEAQIMRRKFRQILASSEVKRIETSLNDFWRIVYKAFYNPVTLRT